MKLTNDLQREFDHALGEVLGNLPDELLKLFEEMPLVVEDRPSDEMLARLGVERPEYLRGLHTGVPLTRRSVRHSGVLPTIITIYRLGICCAATVPSSEIDLETLKKEIKKTILHELGHYFGMSEADLRRHGYG